jgi:multiple sugar transport system ATP-binding protein
MADIQIDSVTKVYPDGTRAVSSVDLQIEDGAFVVLVGPSGCGKTTLLRMIAGLERISDGVISIGGRAVNGVPASRRDIAMVFQSYALYPHMSVYDNIAFGLRRRHVPKREIDAEVRRAADVLGLADQLKKKPRQLSGGQRQRVAMGRAIVRKPQAFLMDEPLSNLDAKLRGHMRTEIARVQRDLGVTTVYVTHDQTEAMTLGDVVAVMNHGEVQQLAAPQALFDHPTNLFVAAFIGSPPMNLLRAELVREDGELHAQVGRQRLRIPEAVRATRPDLDARAGGAIALGIRPEDFSHPSQHSGHQEDGNALEVVVDLRETLGRTAHLHFDLDAPPVLTADTREASIEVETGMEPHSAATTRMAAIVAESAPIAAGERTRLLVDTSVLHYFDLDSGAAIATETAPLAEAAQA